MHYYLDGLRKWRDFSGRSTRKEYWFFVLFNILVTTVVLVLTDLTKLGFLPLLYMAFITVPSIAVAVRRLHDYGVSGWLLLAAFIPYLGGLVLLYFFLCPGEEHGNKYGPRPGAAQLPAESLPD